MKKDDQILVSGIKGVEATDNPRKVFEAMAPVKPTMRDDLKTIFDYFFDPFLAGLIYCLRLGVKGLTWVVLKLTRK